MKQMGDGHQTLLTLAVMVRIRVYYQLVRADVEEYGCWHEGTCIPTSSACKPL